MLCEICEREYDPSMEFVEDVHLLEAMDYFIDIESTCPDCIYKIRDKIEEFIVLFARKPRNLQFRG
jgi:hypothetical protein